jgi:hypothetical protein
LEGKLPFYDIFSYKSNIECGLTESLEMSENEHVDE